MKNVGIWLLVVSVITVGLISVPATSFAACVSASLAPVVYGQNTAVVQNVQECLIANGYAIPAGATGYFGRQTQAAVAAFYAAAMSMPSWNGLSFGPKGTARMQSIVGAQASAPVQATTTIVGGDRDTHGCIGSAGYSWCAAKNKCLRVWEESCTGVSSSTPPSSSTSTTQNSSSNPGASESACRASGGVWFAGEKVCEVNSLSESACAARGGVFNGCASACRHDPKAQVCTMQCVLTCTFGSK